MKDRIPNGVVGPFRELWETQSTFSGLDPNGLDPHEPGAKLDRGKNRLGLVLGDFAHALEHVGFIGTYGAAKYSPRGWMSVLHGEERYTDAMYRHLLKHAQGELHDPESGQLHLAHAAWNALAVLELRLIRKEPADDHG